MYHLVQAWIGAGAFQREPVEERTTQVLGLRERRLGPDDPLVAQSLIRLSDVLSNTGRYDDARPLIERALAIDRAALGPESAAVAGDLNTLARTVILGGDCAEGERLAREFLTLKEQICEVDSPLLITTLTILASCPQRAGRLDEARELRERALRFRGRGRVAVTGANRPRHGLGTIRRTMRARVKGLPRFSSSRTCSTSS